jgi:hypothetical protein
VTCPVNCILVCLDDGYALTDDAVFMLVYVEAYPYILKLNFISRQKILILLLLLLIS